MALAMLLLQLRIHSKCFSSKFFRAIESNRVINGGTLLKLSEQQVVSCASAYGNSGCNGGLPEYAFEYVTDYGQEAETTYVYTALTGTCKHAIGLEVVYSA